jgi:diguanylate cyclase (GGDEF)-like protein/PAS domain S-box-containing protein
VIDNIILEGNFNLKEKKRIALMISHRENQNILKKYLKPEYEVITNDFTGEFEKVDLIILDEQGLKENKEDIFRLKKSESFFYVPLLLITRTAKEEIPDKYLKIIDEIIEIPVKQRTFISRIKNLLSIRSLFLSTQVFQNLVESNPAGICILLEDKKIKYVNKAFLDIIEKNRKNILNKNASEFFSELNLKEFFSDSKKKEKRSSIIKMSISDTVKWLDIQSMEINYKNIKLKSLIFIDITERRQQEKEIEYLSYKDKLTDLYNRRFFEEEMERLDTKRQLPLSIIMADVNGLKIINDSYGHEKGDQLLKKAAQILENTLREEDILARQGGDEFAVLLPKTNKKQAEKILKRIKEETRKSKNKKIPISIALGTATKNEAEQDIKEVFKKADNNMYQNKLSESRSSKSNIVQGLLNTLAAKSYERKEHTLRMTKLAFDFGEKLKLTNSEINRLSLLATLHDIGKTNISEKILNKPEKLNKEEWKIMKNHSEQGYKIALASEEFAVVAEDIFAHHEKWDGSGYPRSLSGEDIPYLARIIAIIDAYDVMTHELPYSKSISNEEALKEIKSCAGSQFDPELADEFIKILNL